MSGSISASTMALVAVATSAAGAATSAMGAIKQGNAAQAAADYNAQIAGMNAVNNKNNAERAAAAGEQNAAQAELKGRAAVGAIRAAQAANNVDVNTGSAVDVRSSAAETGQLNALTIRNNAAREAWGYQNQAASNTAQASLDTMQGQAAQDAASITATSDLLSGAGKAAGGSGDYQAKVGLQNAQAQSLFSAGQ